MAPPGAFARRMRVAGDVGVLVVLATHADPVNGRTFAGHRAQKRQEPPHKRIRLETLVRQQPMVAQAHAQPAGQPRHDQQQQQALPGEDKRRRQGAGVQHTDPKHVGPVQPVRPALRCGGRRGSGLDRGGRREKLGAIPIFVRRKWDRVPSGCLGKCAGPSRCCRIERAVNIHRLGGHTIC